MFQTEMNKEDMLMRDIWESIKEFFARDWTPAEKVLVILCCIMLGVIKGFCLAPISCGNNNGNSYVQTDDGCWNEAE